MYRCEVCETVSAPGTRSHLIPSGYRTTTYEYRRKVNVAHVPWKKKPVLRDDPGGVGYEWEGEIKACASCHAKYQEQLADQQVPDLVDVDIEERLAAK